MRDKIQRVLRNTEEIITEHELKDLLEKRETTTYVGYEPSGKIHLGHLLTVNKLIDLQEVGFKVIILLADVHAYLNEKGSFEEIEKVAEMNREVFIALGLDERKARFVLGSTYQFERDYVINLLKLARLTTLNRAKRSMDEVSRRKTDPLISQMVYPLMQAMDIAYLGVDLAVGGIDQRKIHMLARENLPRIGYKAPVCLHTPILLGLDGEKMSSSKGNFISVDDSEGDVNKKIKRAFCPLGEIENNPVLQMFRYHIFPRYEHITLERDDKFGGDVVYDSYSLLEEDYHLGKIHPMDLKINAAKYINELIEPARRRLKRGVSD
jgi:tyrosyl-tRNA synthetase